MHADIRRIFWPLFGLCAALALAVLVLMPAERTIGQVIKIVYLHGALSRAGMVGFVGAGILASARLVRRKPSLAWWAQGFFVSAWGFWTAHFVVSMPATRLTWGPWIAWGEPRVTMTLQVIAGGLMVIGVTWLLKDDRFTAAAIAGFVVAFLLLGLRTGVLRHPLDPIGMSPSALLQFVYLLLLTPVVAAMILVAWRLSSRQARLAEAQTA